MSILGNLLGGLGLGHRSHGGGMWNRGHGRSRGFNRRGYGRARAPGYFGGSLGRMAMGGLGAYLARGFINRRYRYD
jgi:hypothetical protein